MDTYQGYYKHYWGGRTCFSYMHCIMMCLEEFIENKENTRLYLRPQKLYI